MSALTFTERELLVMVPDGAPEEDWHDGRGEGVTASEIHAIASGSIKTHRTILDSKLNGSTFKGNKHTRRGHEREPFILAEARVLPGVVSLSASGALLGNHDSPLHRATPDGIGHNELLGEFGAEVKHHHEGWTGGKIPADHMDQMQWGMHVTGFDWWLYAWEVEGTEGIQHEWIPRDDARIAQLVHQADAFIAWREAGAPEIDDLPDDVDDALAEYARGMALASEGDALKKANRPIIDAYTATHTPDEDAPLRKGGTRAALFFQPKTKDVLDEDAWAAAEPLTYAKWVEAKAAVAEYEALALALYTKTVPVAATFRVTPNGDPS